MTGNLMPLRETTRELSALAATAKAWTFEEARRLVKRYQRSGYPQEVLF